MKNFEDILKDKLTEFNDTPSESVWNKLDNSILHNKESAINNNSMKASWTKIAVLTVSGFLLAGLGFLVLKTQTNTINPEPRVNEKPAKVLRVKSPRDIKLQDFLMTMEQAKREDKMILVNVFVDNCTFCEQMDEITFVNEAVKEALDKHFVKLDINLRDKTYTDLYEYYNISAAPMSLFMNEKGKLVEKVVGFINPETYLELMEFVIEKNAEGDYMDMESILERYPVLEEYFQRAEKENKSLFVHVYKDDCEECKESSQAIFEHEEFQEKWENEFVFLELSLNDREMYDAFFRFHTISDRPCSMILRNNGSTLKNYWECPTPEKLFIDLEKLFEISVEMPKDRNPLVIKVLPNPNNGNFKLQLKGDATPGTLYFVDMNGQEILRNDLDSFSGNEEFQFNFSNGNGNLVVQFVQGENVMTEKIIIRN